MPLIPIRFRSPEGYEYRTSDGIRDLPVALLPRSAKTVKIPTMIINNGIIGTSQWVLARTRGESNPLTCAADS